MTSLTVRLCTGGALLILAVACRLDDVSSPVSPRRLRVAKPEAALAHDHPERTRDKGRSFRNVPDDSLWFFIVRSDSSADVGLKPAGALTGMDRGRPLLDASGSESARAAILAASDARLITVDERLPIMRVRFTSRESFLRLRRNEHVAYVEPSRFVLSSPNRLAMDGDFGCNPGQPPSFPPNSLLPDGDIVPWAYSYMQIPEAWEYAQGQGVWIGLTDTGIDQYTYELTTGFASGLSSGRNVFLDYSVGGTFQHPLPPWWHDVCIHGTRMAGTIAAPRNGANIVGVAWKANLHSVRIHDNTALEDVSAARLGIRNAAETSRIVAMAWGIPYFQYQSIIDEISFWYYNHDRLFIAAAGTSACWNPDRGTVVFPANQNSIVTAVTRVDHNGVVGCEAHYGVDVDFAAYGDHLSTGASNGTIGLSGSSNAVAIISGIAALMWSQNPSMSRQMLLSSLIIAASPTGAMPSNQYGWGIPNALCAVRHMCTAWIEGASLVEQSGTYTFQAMQQAAPQGSAGFVWSNGATTQAIQRTYTITPGMAPYLDVFSVTVTDPQDGRQRTVSKSVYVRDPYPGCPTCF